MQPLEGFSCIRLQSSRDLGPNTQLTEVQIKLKAFSVQKLEHVKSQISYLIGPIPSLWWLFGRIGAWLGSELIFKWKPQILTTLQGVTHLLLVSPPKNICATIDASQLTSRTPWHRRHGKHKLYPALLSSPSQPWFAMVIADVTVSKSYFLRSFLGHHSHAWFAMVIARCHGKHKLFPARLLRPSQPW